jgi:hypothetical protein
MEMKLDNVLKALDYIIDNEYNHYLECVDDDNEATVQSHIYLTAVDAKTDLNRYFNFM